MFFICRLPKVPLFNAQTHAMKTFPLHLQLTIFSKFPCHSAVYEANFLRCNIWLSQLQSKCQGRLRPELSRPRYQMIAECHCPRQFFYRQPSLETNVSTTWPRAPACPLLIVVDIIETLNCFFNLFLTSYNLCARYLYFLQKKLMWSLGKQIYFYFIFCVFQFIS